MDTQEPNKDAPGGFPTTETTPPKPSTLEICRICYDSDPPDSAPLDILIAPCACRGSMKYVHRTCLNSWRLKSHRRTSFDKCDYCGETYAAKNVWYAGILRMTWARLAVTVILIWLSVLFLGYLGKTCVFLLKKLGVLPMWWGEPYVSSLIPGILEDSEPAETGFFRTVLGLDLPKDPFEAPETLTDWVAPITSFILGLCLFAVGGIWLLVRDLSTAAAFGREPVVPQHPQPPEVAGNPPPDLPAAPAPVAGGTWLPGLAVTSSISMTALIMLSVGLFRASLVVWNKVGEWSDGVLLGVEGDL